MPQRLRSVHARRRRMRRKPTSSCITPAPRSPISIAHEIGHILGARHDRAIDAQRHAVRLTAHGYVNGTKWRDMMSYKEGCDGCPRIPYWSNPRVLYKGEPTGTAADRQRPRHPRAGRARVEVPVVVTVVPAGARGGVRAGVKRHGKEFI